MGDEAKGIAADGCVTVRDRDTMEQVRMPISELKSYIDGGSKIEFLKTGGRFTAGQRSLPRPCP